MCVPLLSGCQSLISTVCFHCTGSDSAADNFRAHIPGVEDFPRIEANSYFLFDNFNFPQFQVLVGIFNDTQRSQTFTFPIYVDDVPEGVEELNITLSLQDDEQLPVTEGSVVVLPSVATVRIHDFSSKFVDSLSSQTIFHSSAREGLADVINFNFIVHMQLV